MTEEKFLTTKSELFATQFSDNQKSDKITGLI
jgi:hypothetical protein